MQEGAKPHFIISLSISNKQSAKLVEHTIGLKRKDCVLYRGVRVSLPIPKTLSFTLKFSDNGRIKKADAQLTGAVDAESIPPYVDGQRSKSLY